MIRPADLLEGNSLAAKAVYILLDILEIDVHSQGAWKVRFWCFDAGETQWAAFCTATAIGWL